LERLDPRRGAAARLVRRCDLRGRPHRRVPHRRLCVPPLLHRLHRRADGIRARAFPPPSLQGGTLVDARSRCRARGALVHRRLPAGRAALASAHQLALAGGCAIFGAKRLAAPRAVPALEKKLYWDELYALIWYRTIDLAARGFYALV